MTITVTQEDIDNGIPKSCSRCPIARAVSRALGTEMEAGPLYIGWDDSSQWYTTPAVALEWMGRFDEGHPVAPFSFELTEKAKR